MSSSAKGLHRCNIETLGKSLTEFLSVNATDIVVVLEFVDVGDKGRSDQQIIDGDDTFCVLDTTEVTGVSISDVLTGGVIFSSCDSSQWELSRLTALNGPHHVQIFHHVEFFKGRQDFTREHFKE